MWDLIGLCVCLFALLATTWNCFLTFLHILSSLKQHNDQSNKNMYVDRILWRDGSLYVIHYNSREHDITITKAFCTHYYKVHFDSVHYYHITVQQPSILSMHNITTYNVYLCGGAGLARDSSNNQHLQWHCATLSYVCRYVASFLGMNRYHIQPDWAPNTGERLVF